MGSMDGRANSRFRSSALLVLGKPSLRTQRDSPRLWIRKLSSIYGMKLPRYRENGSSTPKLR